MKTVVEKGKSCFHGTWVSYRAALFIGLSSRLVKNYGSGAMSAFKGVGFFCVDCYCVIKICLNRVTFKNKFDNISK